MKLHLQSAAGLNVIKDYGAGHVLVGSVRYEASLAILPDQIIDSWARAGFAGLAASDFQQLAQMRPEVVLIGTGTTQRFPHPSLLRPLIEAGIGHEVMDLGAACRTYNILVTEGRRAVAALLLD
ncbi:MAG: Mth938-like domain-containing protein [Pseudomonadota bacterium]|jgi:uncharacterized protein